MSNKFVRSLHIAEQSVVVVLALSATTIMFGNAIARYAFRDALSWAEEVVRLIFVWAMFFAITSAFVRNQHIGFTALVERNAVLRAISGLLYEATLGVVGAIVVYHGLRYTHLTGGVPLAATNLPTALFLIPGLLAGAVWAAVGSVRLVRRVVGLARGRGESE